MNKVTNVVKVLEFATDTQMLNNIESNLDRAKIINFLRAMGFGARQRGIRYIADILCYCYAYKVYEIDTLRDFYEVFANNYYNFNEQQTKKMIWNIDDSIDYLEKSPTRNDELLCSIFYEFNYFKEITPKPFFNDFLEYVYTNENDFIKK